MSRSKTSFIRKVFQTASVTLAGAIGVGLFFVALFVFNLFHGLPDVKQLKDYHHPNTTEVFSDDGQKIAEFTNERRYPVDFNEIPKHVIQAFIAAEDSNFYEHHGIDFQGIGRAIVSNVIKGRFAQGGSTITQQVARSILLETRKKEITRKVREMILARRMERELTKNEILHLYLSEIYLGHGAFGIAAAAKNYFNKDVKQLTLAEGAILAALPQRPHEWNPFHNPYRSKVRQAYVLKRMVETGYVDPDTADKALRTPVKLYAIETLNDKAAPYFTEYVRQYLMKKYSSEKVLSEGYKVYTTVKYDFQKAAENSLEKGLREVDKRLGWRGVTSHLNTPLEVETFLEKTHRRVIEKLNPPRVFPADVDSNTKELGFDLSVFQKKSGKYYGETPLEEGKLYDAVVQSVDDKNFLARVSIGQTYAVLPFSAMEWVSKKEAPLSKVSEVLKVGDVISVRVDRMDHKGNGVQVSLEQEPEIQGGFLSYETENGFVRAMVGGRDFNTTKFNCALQAKRQVGSTFKPLIYAAAIDKGYSPSSIVTDSPLVFKYEGKLDADASAAAGEDWKPHNYGNKFEGDIPIRLALIRSMNIPTVKILNEIGVDYGIQYARTLGITAVLPRDLTIALGSWSSSLEEVMRAYAIFPRLGKPVELVYIRKVLAPDGSTVEEYSPQAVVTAAPTPTPTADSVEGGFVLENGRVISPQTAYVMTDMLRGVIREGTGRPAAFVPGAIAGKTGTSNDHRDAWFVGYSPHLMAGVWLGYEKDKPLDVGETGGKAAAPIWGNYMKAVLPNYAKTDFSIPDDIVFAQIDRQTGRLATHQTQNRVRVAFKVGTVPNQLADNILHIGEPGVKPSIGAVPGDATRSQSSQPPENTEDTTDYLREGYQN